MLGPLARGLSKVRSPRARSQPSTPVSKQPSILKLPVTASSQRPNATVRQATMPQPDSPRIASSQPIASAQPRVQPDTIRQSATYRRQLFAEDIPQQAQKNATVKAHTESRAQVADAQTTAAAVSWQPAVVAPGQVSIARPAVKHLILCQSLSSVTCHAPTMSGVGPLCITVPQQQLGSRCAPVE